MNTMTKIGVTLTGVVLAMTLAGCGDSTEETVTTPSPTPTTTTTVTPPPAGELDGDVVTERNENGDFVLPDGSTITCPAESQGVFVMNDGEVTCDAGVDW